MTSAAKVRSVEASSPRSAAAAIHCPCTAVVGTSLMWCFGVPMAYFLSTSLGLGLAGIWLAMGLDEGVRGCMNYLRWRTGRWRQLGVVQGAGASSAPLAEPSPSV